MNSWRFYKYLYNLISFQYSAVIQKLLGDNFACRVKPWSELIPKKIFVINFCFRLRKTAQIYINNFALIALRLETIKKKYITSDGFYHTVLIIYISNIIYIINAKDRIIQVGQVWIKILFLFIIIRYSSMYVFYWILFNWVAEQLVRRLNNNH